MGRRGEKENLLARDSHSTDTSVRTIQILDHMVRKLSPLSVTCTYFLCVSGMDKYFFLLAYSSFAQVFLFCFLINW